MPFIVWKYLHRFRGPFLERPGNLTGPKWYFEIKVGCVLTCNEINFVSLATISTISEVIVRVKRNIKQNRNWFYFKFSVESSSFIFNNFKMEKFKLTFESCTRVSFCQNLLHFALGQIRTVKRIVMALMPSLIFRCFSLFLPHLRTLAQEKRSENCLHFGTGGLSLGIHYCCEV